MTSHSRNRLQNSAPLSTQSDRRRAELHCERERRLLVLRLRPLLLLLSGARGRLRPAQVQVQADAQQSEPQPNNLFFDLNILMRVSNCPLLLVLLETRLAPSWARGTFKSIFASTHKIQSSFKKPYAAPSFSRHLLQDGRDGTWKPFLPIWQHAVGTRRLKARCKAAPYSALRKMK